MTSFLKNYTSDVPVVKTITRIEQCLIRCGVSGISKHYGPTGEIAAIVFSINLPGNPKVQVRLPSDREAALNALWLDYADGEQLSDDSSRLKWSSKKRKKRDDFIEQADRTAWKLMQDWVEVQLSLIQMKQADFVQVFLPYVWDSRRQITYYEAVKAGGFKGLLPESTT